MIRRTLMTAGFTVLVAGGAFAQDGDGTVTITGELKRWHKITLTLSGPQASETGTPNPFLDYDFTVTFTNGSLSYTVPGYFAADGNAANSSASSGNKWRAHLCPDLTGTWTYSISFRSGSNIAVNGGGTALAPYHGKSGSFTVAETDKTGRDFRAKGRLQYVGGHHLRFKGTGEYFLKQGADSPENLLAYADFDGPFKSDGQKDDLIKTWSPHVGDWKTGDPTWQGGKGKGLIGALNYLASKGMNAISFLTMNINGDDRNVFPYLTYSERLRMDVSRLDQWEIVFEHADKLGMYLHFKTQETENELLLDGGDLGIQRKLYYRELIARFAHHLALNWNLGEEIDNATTAQKQAWAQYFYDHDPYRHHIVIHNGASHYDLLGSASKVTGFSLQIGPDAVFSKTKDYIDRSVAAGKPWVVAWDETNPAGDGVVTDAEDYWHDTVRKGMWGHLTAGGAGCEYYFGYNHPHSDLTCQDFRSRDHWWDLARFALEFFKNNAVPFWEMKNDDGLTSSTSDHCLRKTGYAYVVYLPSGGTTSLNLSGVSGSFSVRWFDPRNGGPLKTGSVSSVSGGGIVGLGNPPSDASKDWVILVKRTDVPSTPPTAPSGLTATTISSSQINLSWTDNANNEDGFKIERKTGSAGTWGQIATVGAGVTSYSNTGLSASTTYYYRVRAYNSAGDTAYSNEATATTLAGSTGQAVTSFTLINADTDADLGPLAHGATLNLATLPTRNLNVRAETDPATVGSVRFAYDGNSNYRTENSAPYALAGDTSGDYNSWTPAVGNHTLTATPYTGSGATGTAGTPLTVSFTVIDQAPAPLPAAPTNLIATAISSSQINLSWTDNSSNETGFRIERKTGSAGTWGQIAAVGAGVTTYSNTGLSASTTYYYRVRAFNSAGDSAYSNEASATTLAGSTGPAVTGFTLINADTDLEIGPLNEGAVLDLSSLPTRNLNVRANTTPITVGSVRFAYDGNSNYRTENVAPYALAGDTAGDYYAWTPSSGTHTLTATPWTGSGATGTAGTPKSVTFTVLGGALLEASLVEIGGEEEIPSGEEDSEGKGRHRCGALGIEFVLPILLFRAGRRR